MNLSDELRDIAIGVTARGDLVRYAADIIDSLPKAEDGSVIWKGCYIVAKAIDALVMRVGARACGPITKVMPGRVSSNGFQWVKIDMVLSAHRTQEEAEAAAKRAGGEG